MYGIINRILSTNRDGKIRKVNPMSEKSADRRTVKTKKALRDALAELLTEKELQKITVQEIANIADVNRVTFYKHFLDVYDLYDKTVQEIIVEIGLLILQLEELQEDKVFDELVSYVERNRTVFKMIFCPNVKSSLRLRFETVIEGLFLQLEAEKLGIGLSDSRLAYYNRYRSHGCVAVLEKWVADNFTETKEFMVRTLSELDSHTEKIIYPK